MNAEVKILRTGAEETLSRLLGEALPVLPGADWVRAMRAEGAERFESLGLPHRRVEAWRWTDLRAAMREVPPLAVPSEGPVSGGYAGLEAYRLVFVNGFARPDLSSAMPEGVELVPLLALLGQPRNDLSERLGSLSRLGEPVPLSLNAAFALDGAAIRVRAGVALDKPVHLAFVVEGEAASIYPRNLIVAERGAKATILETYEGPAGTSYQVNSVTELFVQDRAELRHVRVEDEGLAALHLGATLTELGAEARFESFTLVAGAALSRHQIGLAFTGEGASANVSGVSLLSGRQHGDVSMLIDHAVPHCESRERFKAALDGTSRGVFQGKIIVRRGAQKVDAKMSANALFLAEGAEFNGKPELEIFADDVQCGHGATAGELDENHVFYLMARGIPRAEAEALLVRAYVAEALETVSEDAVRALLESRADVWLSGREASPRRGGEK